MEWNSLSGKFEDIKGVARRCKAKNRKCNGQQKKGHTIIYKKLEMEQHKSH
jgi:hypothetical protein